MAVVAKPETTKTEVKPEAKPVEIKAKPVSEAKSVEIRAKAEAKAGGQNVLRGVEGVGAEIVPASEAKPVEIKDDLKVVLAATTAKPLTADNKKPCFRFKDTGECPFGDDCIFSHKIIDIDAVEEIQSKTPCTWYCACACFTFQVRFWPGILQIRQQVSLCAHRRDTSGSTKCG